MKDETIKGDAIVYDMPTTLPSYTNKQFDQCVVHVRPLNSWKGENFGFDWVRIGDTKIPGDKIYPKIMGKYYKTINKVKQVDPDSNSHNGTFEKDMDAKNFGDLIRRYFPVTYTIAWKTKSHNHKEIWKNYNEQVNYTYYVPTMTLKNGVTANLLLKVKFAGKKTTPPKRIFMREQGNDNYFSIDDTALQPKQGDYKCSIQCTTILLKERYIDVIAVYPKLVEEGDEEKLCGQLRVLPHRLIFNQIDILFVEVATDLGTGRTVGKINNNEESIIRKVLNQAMLSCNIKTISLEIDANKTIHDPQDSNSNGRLIDRSKNGNYCSSGGIMEFCLWELQRQKPDCYNRKGEIKVFILGNKFETVKTSQNGTPTVTTNKKGFTNKDKEAVVLFNGKVSPTPAHEILHALGLDHSFAGVDNGLFTYKYQKTENIMDYSTIRFNTWRWQWELLWQKAESLEFSKIQNQLLQDQPILLA